MTSQLLTTDAVEPIDRFAYWREVICAVYVQLDAEPAAEGTFTGTVEMTPWGGTRISSVSADGQIVNRSPDDRRTDCLVSLQLSGVGRVTQAGRTAVLHPGDMALYDATRPYELAFDDPFAQIVVQFPRDALIARNIHIESAVAQHCSGDRGSTGVASTFVQTLRKHDDEFPNKYRGRLGEQALDLIAMALASATGVTASHEAARTYSRQRVLNHMDTHLGDPKLSVGSIAAHFGVSTRSIQKLFSDDELHLGDRIRRGRLSRAKLALKDPLRSHHTIARIAHDHGYSDAAHFSRAFKAAYDCTPSEFRGSDHSVN